MTSTTSFMFQDSSLYWSTLMKSPTKDRPNTWRNDLVEVHGWDDWRIHLVIFVYDTLLLIHVLNLFGVQKLVQSATIEEDIFGTFNVNATIVVCSNSIKPWCDFGTAAWDKGIALGIYFPTNACAQGIISPIWIQIIENMAFSPPDQIQFVEKLSVHYIV